VRRRDQTATVSAGLGTRLVTGGVPTPYAARVLAAVDRIPRGRVMSYADVAEYVGAGSGRSVGAVLSRHGHEVPWQRVVLSTGEPAPSSPEEALRLLRAEGVPMRGDRVDMARARWDGSDPAAGRDEAGEPMDEVLDLHRRALEEFGRRVHAVRPDQWTCPTPCRDWEVRMLVNHLVVEQLWVPPLLDGRTVAEVGDRLAGDQLGDDPVRRWDEAAAAAQAALEADGALGRTVHLSYGDRPAHEYARELVFDLVVHAWDLARATDGDEKIDPSLVEAVYGRIEPDADLSGTGMYDPPVPVPPDADEQTRLIAATGRRP
jgi:uncharacterized protein (TIGR03086 family)